MFFQFQGHQYETVSGFICETYGCIPNTGDKIQVVLERVEREVEEDYAKSDGDADQPDEREKTQTFELEVSLSSFSLFFFQNMHASFPLYGIWKSEKHGHDHFLSLKRTVSAHSRSLSDTPITVLPQMNACIVLLPIAP